MTLTTLVPPIGEPVSPAELKAHLRVTHSAEDDLLVALLSAARERLEAELGLRIVEATLRETFEPGVGPVSLAVGPVVEITAAARDDGAGGWTALAPTAWRRSGDRPALVRLPRSAAVRIDYRAGVASSVGAAPPSLKQAVLVLATEAYERRGDPDAHAPPGLGAAETWAAPWRRARL